jgi:type III restriction enzyme
MRVRLREYQEVATVRLLRVLAQARQGLLGIGSPQGVQFSAPTGAGKTVVLAAVIEAALAGNEFSATAAIPADPEMTFLWLSDLPELNRQSLTRIQSVTTNLNPTQLVEIDQDFDRHELEAGKAYFLNYQKLRTGSLLTRIGDVRTTTIWETIAATQRARPGKLIVVIDEAHRGLGSQRTAQTIASRFVVGAQQDASGFADPMVRDGLTGALKPLPPMDIVVGVSATPERFNTYLNNTGGRSLHPIQVDPADVRASGLIKDRLVLNGPQEGDAAWTLLEKAAEKTLDFERQWDDYTQANELDPVIPALLVQVQDGTAGRPSDTPLAQVLETLRKVWPTLRPEEIVHCFHGSARLDLGPGWSIAYREPSEIATDHEIRVVLFKTALNTGWDCPRAEVLMSFRPLQDRTAIAQLVGRMVRTPLGSRVAGDTTLNSTHLFLPYFDRDELEQVRKDLMSETGDIGTEVERAEDIQELVVRPDGVPLFDRLKIVPTEVIPSSRPIPDIRRLIRFARLIEQDGLEEHCARTQLGALSEVLRQEMTSRQGNPGFAEGISSRGRVTVSSLSIENGLVVAEENHEAALSDDDIQAAFRTAGLLVSEDLAATWLKERFDPDAPLEGKLEFLELTSSPAVLLKLQSEARKLLAELEIQHHHAIVSLPPARAELYGLLQRSGRVVQTAIMAPAWRVVFPLPPEARQIDRHLYVRPETEDACALSLTSWEADAVSEERRHPTFRGFLRNLDRKQWSLSYAYEYGGIRPGYPDLIVFRGSPSGELLVDLLEPHLDAGDSVAKAKGLANFAKNHGKAFGRVEMLRRFEANGPLYRLALNEPGVASAVIERVVSTADLNQAFKDIGYVADW